MTSELLSCKIFIHSYYIFIKEKKEVLASIALVVLFSAVLKNVCSLFTVQSVFARLMTVQEKLFLTRAIETQKEDWG